MTLPRLVFLMLAVGCNAPAGLVLAPDDPGPVVPPPPPSGGTPLRGSWTPLSPIPEPRWQVGITEMNGLVYVAGGVRGFEFSAPPQIHAYEPDSDRWTTVGTLRLPVRAPAVAATGGRVYVVGGFLDDPWEPVGNLQILDPASGTVTDGPLLPTARGGAAIAVHQSKLHLIGGVVPDGSPIFDMGMETNAHEMFDPTTGQWTTLAPIPSGRWGHAAVTVDGKIFVVGGIPGRIEVYHPDTDSWTTLGEGPVRLFAAAAALDGAIYLIGGAEFSDSCCDGPTATDAMDRLDLLSMTWESMRPMLEARTGHGAAVIGGYLYVMGGSPYGPESSSRRNERFSPR